jgi:RNA polymerase sigma-70 factor (ECF subfamily)
MTERNNEQWVNDLSSTSQAQEAALADLRALIVKSLPYALNKYLSPSDPQFHFLVEETAQDTLLRVLDRLDTFEGRSKFTTWVYTIAVRIALTELRRMRWRDVSLDKLLDDEERFPPPGLMTDPASGPEDSVEGSDLLAQVRQIIQEELTDKQRTAMIAIGVKGMPIAEVARRMGTNRNALYKLMHDARLRLKRRLARQGLTPEDILEVFERE